MKSPVQRRGRKGGKKEMEKNKLGCTRKCLHVKMYIHTCMNVHGRTLHTVYMYAVNGIENCLISKKYLLYL